MHSAGRSRTASRSATTTGSSSWRRRSLRLPLVILATAATIIASQAVITGAYSLTQQAIQLGLLPRMDIRRTSETQTGQIFLPQINNMLLIGVLLLVLMFQTSDNLSHAYGLAVTGTMLVDHPLAYIVVRRMWKWGPLRTAALIGPLVVDGPGLPRRQRAEVPLRRLGAAG